MNEYLKILGLADCLCSLFSISYFMENPERMLHELETSYCTCRTMESSKLGINIENPYIYVWPNFS